jgi:drug/metabolite transporter (DMT)-like permease
MSGTSPVTNRVLLLAAAVLFSTGGAAIKATSLTGWQVSSFRAGVAAAVLLALIPGARTGWTWRVALVGGAYASVMVLFVLSTKLTTAANAIFLQSTAPLYLLLLSPWLLHERIHRADVFFLVIVALGLALFFVDAEPAVATAPDPIRGNNLAAIAGLAWALTMAGLRWRARSDPAQNRAITPVVAGNLIAFGACLPLALPVSAVGIRDLAVIVYLGVFQIGLAYVCLTRALRGIPAFEAVTLLLLEPVLNPVWAWLLHDERPGRWSIAGGALILGATLANTWRKGRGTA